MVPILKSISFWVLTLFPIFYEFLYSGYWEHKLFTALCEYWKYVSLSSDSSLGFREFLTDKADQFLNKREILCRPLRLSLQLSLLWYSALWILVTLTLNSQLFLFHSGSLSHSVWVPLPVLLPGAVVWLNCLFPISQGLQGWAAWWPVSEHLCFIFFDQFFSYVRQKSKFSLCYSIISWNISNCSYNFSSLSK